MLLKLVRGYYSFRNLKCTYLSAISRVLTPDNFNSFKFSAIFRYKKYFFNYYQDKLCISFNNLRKFSSIPFLYSIIPFDVFATTIFLDFIKIINLIYASFFIFPDDSKSKFVSNNKDDSFLFQTSNDLNFKKGFNCIAPIGYLRHR